MACESADPGSPFTSVQMKWGVRIPMRDGVCLNATAYMPAQQATPAPAIFTLTPYIAQTYHERGIYFAASGYPFLTIDVRGRGNSEGVFKPLLNEGQDGFDVIEWLARQPYCNGQVSMWGGSYGGYVQWAAAKEFPPHLATIVPVASPYVGLDFPLRAGMAVPFWMQWLTLVAGRTSQDKMFWNNADYWGAKFRQWFESGVPFKCLDAFLGADSTIFQEWVGHPNRGEYWDRCNPTPNQYAMISCPILTITGAYDDDQLGALQHYREHMRNATAEARALHYLIIGPWDHAGTRNPAREFAGLKVGPESLLDLPLIHRQWYEWTMQGGARPAFLQKNVAYYVMGLDEWRYADSLDAVTERLVSFYLRSDKNPTDIFHSGWLANETSQPSEPDWYEHDPRDVSLAALESTIDPENRADHRIVYASVGKRLIYHSAPFETDTEISGFFKLCVWLSIDQPDTDFSVAVYEVGLDGSAIQLTADWMRARYRESEHEQRLICTTKPLLYQFDRFTFISRQIKQGHRLRLVIGPLHSIYSEKNYNSGGVVAEECLHDARRIVVRLYHDQERPSALYVPIGRSAVTAEH